MAIKNYLSNTGSWAKHTAFVAMFSVMGALLASCGGGGAASTTPAAPVVVPPPPVIALGVLPGAADVFADLPTDISISGGTAPYTAGSSNIVLVPAPAVTGSSTTGFKVTILAKSANVDTPVIVTIRDSLGATANIALNVKATTLNNAVTITPLSPSGTGCGTGICSGGDARVVVTALLNGVRLTNRPIRFDVFQGDFRFVTPGTNALVTSIVVNTDENGEAVVRFTVTVTAPTQVATLTSTDTVSGLVRRTNFNIIQQVSGVGILSILPSGPVTFTAGKAPVGQPALCPFGGVVDHYIYGGTPPYTVVSPLPQFLSVFPSIVTTNGGSYRVTQSGCGTASIIVTDALNRVLESSAVIGAAGLPGDAAATPTPTALTVTPSGGTSIAPDHVLATCSDIRTSATSGSGTFTTTTTAPGIVTVSPPSGTIGDPSGISFRRSTGTTIVTPTTVTVNVVAGTITRSVLISITGPATCTP